MTRRSGSSMWPLSWNSVETTVRRVAMLGLYFLLLAAPALAQEGAGPSTESTTGWVFRWLNFAIVFGLLYWGLAKTGPHFRHNSEEISRKIAEGTRAREVAEQQQREAQAKLAGIGQEVAELRAEAKRGAEAEALRVRALAKAEAEAIERAAQAEIAAAEHAARMELKTVVARMAIERAEAVLRQEMTPQAEAALFGTFVAELQGSTN